MIDYRVWLRRWWWGRTHLAIPVNQGAEYEVVVLHGDAVAATAVGTDYLEAAEVQKGAADLVEVSEQVDRVELSDQVQELDRVQEPVKREPVSVREPEWGQEWVVVEQVVLPDPESRLFRTFRL